MAHSNPRSLPETLTLNEPFDLKHTEDIGAILDIGDSLADDFQDVDFFNKYDIEGLDNKSLHWQFPQNELAHCSFEELWLKMTPIDDDNYLRKRVITQGNGDIVPSNSYVKVMYCGYWEHEEDPFEFTHKNNPIVVKLGSDQLRKGQDLALKSMCAGEYSQFLISPDVMYGDFGCEPRLRPSAFCLFHFTIVEVLNEYCLSEKCEDDTIFVHFYKKAKERYLTGKMYYKSSEYFKAIYLFKTALNKMENCRLADEEEEVKQQNFLFKIYLSLAVCYNKAKLPLKACSMCNEIKNMNMYWKNSKVLFQNGKALAMIGCFDLAENRLVKALKLSPNIQEIITEIENVKKKKKMYSQYNKSVRKNADAVDNNVTEKFVKSVEELCISFSKDEHTLNVKLDPGLNDFERQSILSIADKYNLNVEIGEDKCLTIKKQANLTPSTN